MKNQMKNHKEIMMSEAVETNPIQDLINHSLNQDYNKANEIFGTVVGQKLDFALEQEKIRLANSVYNGVDQDASSDNEEQLEFDLDNGDDGDVEEDGPDQDTEENGSDINSETESDIEETEEVEKSDEVDGHPV